jgi:CheY-like chemotaxis protein
MGPWVPGNAHPDKGKLATRLPLSFLVVEDNRVLRKILVRMLQDLGYTHIIEAYDGADAVRQMERHRQRMRSGETTYNIDVVLMDLWMPTMNGYQATEKILGLYHGYEYKPPVVMAVTADTTDEATERVARAGMKGPLTKPYKTRDLERNLLELGI